MGGKHGKYVYVRREDGWYIKVRVFKNRREDDPSRYIIVGPKRRNPPSSFEVLDASELPEDVQRKLWEI